MMNTKLVTVTDNEPTMSSLDLLEVINQYRLEDGKKEKRHDTFMRDIKDELEEAAPQFCGTVNRPQPTGGTRDYPCYNLPKDECMQMAMRESKSVRKRVVKQLNELMKRIETLSIPDFSNPAIAARAWAEQYEVAQLTSAKLTEATKEIEVKDKKITEDKPKVRSFDVFIDKAESVDLRTAAKLLGVKPMLFNRKLRAKKWIYKGKSNLNNPSRIMVEKGIMEVKVTTLNFGIGFQTMVTPFGLGELRKYVDKSCQDILAAPTDDKVGK